MTQIPEDVKKKIGDYLNKFKHQVSSEGLENIETDIKFGYSLSQQTIKERDEEIEKWQEDYREFYEKLLIAQGEIESLKIRISEIVYIST